MLKTTVSIVSLFSLLLFCFASIAKDVTILANDDITIERLLGQQSGYLDTDTNIIVLDEVRSLFNIIYEKAPRNREALMFNLSKPTCTINRIETKERLSRYYFSQPVNAYLPAQLYQISTNPSLPIGLLDEAGMVKHLNELFSAQTNKVLLQIEDYKYPQQLQSEIDSVDPDYILPVQGEDRTGRSLQLLLRGRADFIIESPLVIKDWYAADPNSEPLRAYAIAAASELSLGRFMCNKSALDSGFLSHVNEAIAILMHNNKFDAIYHKYLSHDDAETILNYLKQYDFQATQG